MATRRRSGGLRRTRPTSTGRARSPIVVALGAAGLLLPAACRGEADRSVPTGTSAAAAPAGSVSTAVAPATTPTTLAFSPEGLAATLQRYRQDDSTGRLQIQVTNGSGATVVLDGLQLRWAGFTVQPPVEEPAQLVDRQVVDLPVPAGTAVCPNGGDFAVDLPVGAPVAVATATFGGAAPVPVTIPITDVRGVLARLYVPACQEAALAATATVTFGATWTDTTIGGQPAATGVLRVQRPAGGTGARVVVEEVLGTVLLRIAALAGPAVPASSAAPWVVLEPSMSSVELPVALLQSGDCRPHALAESKHTFFLRATVTVQDGPTLTIYVRPDADDEAQLLQLISHACGVG